MDFSSTFKKFEFMGRKPQSLKGQRFGSLVVLSFISRNLHGLSKWLCECDCGCRMEAMYQNLKRGKTKSCGCMPRGRSAGSFEPPSE